MHKHWQERERKQTIDRARREYKTTAGRGEKYKPTAGKGEDANRWWIRADKPNDREPDDIKIIDRERRGYKRLAGIGMDTKHIDGERKGYKPLAGKKPLVSLFFNRLNNYYPCKIIGPFIP